MLVAIVFSAQRLMMQKNNTLLNIIGLVIYIICTYILFMILKPFIATYNVYDRQGRGIIRIGIFFSPKRLNDLHRRRVFIHHRHKQNRFRRSSSTVTEPMHRRRCHNTTLLHMCICIIYYCIIYIHVFRYFFIRKLKNAQYNRFSR